MSRLRMARVAVDFGFGVEAKDPSTGLVTGNTIQQFDNTTSAPIPQIMPVDISDGLTIDLNDIFVVNSLFTIASSSFQNDGSLWTYTGFLFPPTSQFDPTPVGQFVVNTPQLDNSLGTITVGAGSGLFTSTLSAEGWVTVAGLLSGCSSNDGVTLTGLTHGDGDDATTGDGVTLLINDGRFSIESGGIVEANSVTNSSQTDWLYVGGRLTVFSGPGGGLTNAAGATIYVRYSGSLGAADISNSGDLVFESGGVITGVNGSGAHITNTGILIGDITLTGQTDVYAGGAGELHGSIHGGGGNDNFTGGAIAESFYGDAGDDTLAGGAGADALDGGVDNDTASYGSAAANVKANLSNPSANTGDAAGDTYVSIENLTGSSFNDALTGDSNVNVLRGSAGDDVLSGGAGGDTLAGGDGVDTVSYAGASVGVTVRLWNQTATGGIATGDHISNIENVVGSNGNDALVGSDGFGNVLTGGAGNDYLEGRGGDDMLIGGAGADKMVGGDGSDTISYDGSLLAVTIKLWNSTATGGNATGDTINGIENVVGGGGADALIGSDNVGNTLIGGAGNDYLEGRSGDDTLSGGAGVDKLVGGVGNDTFVLSAGQANGDIITDFAGNGAGAGDLLTLSGYGTAGAGAHIVQLDATHWQIVSADGLIHDTITLTNGASIDPSDYIFGP